ncbi:MAG: TIGR04325 family methyltransferase [Bacteroidales bacterium]
MGSLKQILKKILPDSIQRFITGLFYGWYGNYSSWQEASSHATGYDSQMILEKVISATKRVKGGKSAYEKDSVLFQKTDYSYPVLTSLLWITAQNKGRLHVLDFGGSLGSTYFQNKKFLNELPEIKWCIVEQSGFVKAGKDYFEDDKLKFYYSIDQCTELNEIDVILFSSVLQYIEKPYEILDEIKKTKIQYVIIDRTAFIDGNDRITVQKVNPNIYEASYPCWFFNKEKFIHYMKSDFEIMTEFDSQDRSNIKSEFKGFLFKRTKG